MVDLDGVLGGVREHYTPDASTQKRVRTAVAVALVAGGATVASGAATASAGNAVATGGAASVAKATAAGVVWTKLAAGVSIVVVVAGSGALLWQGAKAVEPTQQAEVPVVASPPIAPREVITHTAPVESREVESPSSITAPGSTVAAVSLEAPQSSVNHLVASKAPAAPAPERASRSGPKPAESSMLDELRLLADASRSLRSGQVDEASRLLQEHAKRYPTSTLKSERWGMQLLLRCSQAGGSVSADTRRAAEKFVRGAPSSPLARHIQRECLE